MTYNVEVKIEGEWYTLPENSADLPASDFITFDQLDTVSIKTAIELGKAGLVVGVSSEWFVRLEQYFQTEE